MFDIQKKKRGINSLLDSRVSTPIPLTSIPRRSNYGICNLSLRNRPVKTGTCGKLRVKDSNKCYLLIICLLCLGFLLFDYFGSTNVFILFMYSSTLIQLHPFFHYIFIKCSYLPAHPFIVSVSHRIDVDTKRPSQ